VLPLEMNRVKLTISYRNNVYNYALSPTIKIDQRHPQMSQGGEWGSFNNFTYVVNCVE